MVPREEGHRIRSGRSGFGERFLAEPLNLPDRDAAGTWGDGTAHLTLAGATCSVLGLSPQQAGVVKRRFSGFLTAPGCFVPEASLEVYPLPDAAFRTITERGWVYTFDLSHDADGLWFSGLQLVGRLDLTTPLRCSLWTCAARASDFEGVIDNTLRLLTAYLLLQHGGVLLHAAGVVHGPSASVLLGQSGAGKSTFSRVSHAEGLHVVSDDLVALVPRGGRTCLARVPFGSEFRPTGDPGAVEPLTALCRLEKAAAIRFAPTSLAVAVGSAFACSPVVNGDGVRSFEVLATLERLIAGIPHIGVLGFPKNGPLWSAVPWGDGRCQTPTLA
ncbi:MAG: hypothetical protein KA072_02730 [Thermoanaerobaculaceae bacterium]|nr:hypothetical protein [Thermoanaerobaculaceae bacterium]MDI9620517.1 hypothetical protein [Acidobacteriota bacterium]NLH11276.1 hypothetical protein [Holophagae bacterium]HPW55244.1 hypothetical protein [Thermoanaerobaculaceae bacterium]